jgi:hypothetical protein
LQTIGVFAQIQTLVHQSSELKSSNGRPRPSSSGKSYLPKAHSVLPFSNFILDSFFCLFLFLIGLAEILIPVEDQSPSYFLGPVGTSDPLEFIEAEYQRIPFKAALSKPHEWQDNFKDWPLPPIVCGRNWYKRMLDDDSAKTSNWDSLCIAQCLELSMFETPKNENLLIAAYHFWSNGVNAFLFGHGPMSPTLAGVYMITNLDITGSVYSHK